MSDIDKVIEVLQKKVDEAKLAYLDSVDRYANGFAISRETRKYNQGAYDGLASAWCAVIRLKQELEAGK